MTVPPAATTAATTLSLRSNIFMNTSGSAGEVSMAVIRGPLGARYNGDLRESIAQAGPELRAGSGFLDTSRSSSPCAQALPTLAEILLQSGKEPASLQQTQFSEFSRNADLRSSKDAREISAKDRTHP